MAAGVATHFSVSVPANATAKIPFDFTVTAQDADGNTATGYTGTVHFTSSDPAAQLPADTTLANGTGTFKAALITASSNTTITATDTASSSVTGTSDDIGVAGFLTLGSGFDNPVGVAASVGGFVYVADFGSGNVYKMDAWGDKTTLASEHQQSHQRGGGRQRLLRN